MYSFYWATLYKMNISNAVQWSHLTVHWTIGLTDY